MKPKIFISHANEDKVDVALPLARFLQRLGIDVWLDVYKLKLGEGLRQGIDNGLSEADYGVVILSPHFFRKRWTNEELEGLLARELAGGERVIPVWHRVTSEQVRQFSPILAGRIAARTHTGLKRVAAQIVAHIEDSTNEEVLTRLEHVQEIEREPPHVKTAEMNEFLWAVDQLATMNPLPYGAPYAALEREIGRSEQFTQLTAEAKSHGWIEPYTTVAASFLRLSFRAPERFPLPVRIHSLVFSAWVKEAVVFMVAFVIAFLSIIALIYWPSWSIGQLFNFRYLLNLAIIAAVSFTVSSISGLYAYTVRRTRLLERIYLIGLQGSRLSGATAIVVGLESIPFLGAFLAVFGLEAVFNPMPFIRSDLLRTIVYPAFSIILGGISGWITLAEIVVGRSVRLLGFPLVILGLIVSYALFKYTGAHRVTMPYAPLVFCNATLVVLVIRMLPTSVVAFARRTIWKWISRKLFLD